MSIYFLIEFVQKKVVRRVGFQMKDVFGFKFEDRLTQLACWHRMLQ
jgi:hypothetical protein